MRIDCRARPSRAITDHRFPRLMCDLGGMMVTPGERGGYGRYWSKHTPYIHLVQADGGKVYPDMLLLFEDFSDRFLLGTDTAHTPALRFYEERIEAFRQMLSQMSPATAKRIAYENAERLYEGKKPGPEFFPENLGFIPGYAPPGWPIGTKEADGHRHDGPSVDDFHGHERK